MSRNQTKKEKIKKIVMVTISLLGLFCIYIFQDYLDLSLYTNALESESSIFLFKKAMRLVLNDTCMLLFIYAWFQDNKITKTAAFIQAIDTFVLLPLYLILKLTIEGNSEISSPLLSQLHRLIVNPTLMILYIPAIYYNRIKSLDHN